MQTAKGGVADKETHELVVDRPGMQPTFTKGGEGFSIAVVIPCYNEETTIKRVVHDFRDHLPNARIYI